MPQLNVTHKLYDIWAVLCRQEKTCFMSYTGSYIEWIEWDNEAITPQSASSIECTCPKQDRRVFIVWLFMAAVNVPTPYKYQYRNEIWFWGEYKKPHGKQITHSKDIEETVVLQPDILKMLWATTESQSKCGAPSISLQPLICFPSGFLFSALFLILILFPTSGNFPTAAFMMIWPAYCYDHHNCASFFVLCFQF